MQCSIERKQHPALQNNNSGFGWRWVPLISGSARWWWAFPWYLQTVFFDVLGWHQYLREQELCGVFFIQNKGCFCEKLENDELQTVNS